MKKFTPYLMCFALFSACSGDEESEAIASARSEKVWNITAATIELKRAQPTARLLGNVESFAQSNIVAKVAGDVARVDIQSGDIVEKEQVLVLLDTTELALSLDQAEAQRDQADAAIAAQINTNKLNNQLLEAAKEQYELAQRQYERIDALAQQRNVSERTLDEQRQSLLSQRNQFRQQQTIVDSESATMNSLRAQKKSADVAVRMAELNLEYATIKAPFNGIVTSVTTAVGSRVQVGQVILSAFSTDSVEVRVSVPEALIASFRQSILDGQPLTAKSNTGNFILDRVSGTVSVSGAGTDAYFKPVAYSENLTLGKTESVTVSLPSQDGIAVIPAQAIHGTNRVFIVEPDTEDESLLRLKGIDVDILGQQQKEGQSVVLISGEGIDNGVKVLTSPLPSAVNGLAVEIIE